MKKYLGLTALAGVFAVGGGWMLTQGTATNTTHGPAAGLTALPGAAMAQDAAEVDISTVQEMVLGSADAPVTVIEYGSFTCPHCATFHNNQFQELNAEYIESGQVQFIFREVYFDRFGLWASMIARCGDGSRFFPIHDLLYEDQAGWIAGGQDPALIAANLRTIGITAGLTAEEVDACMADEGAARTLVAWFEHNATEDEVNSTPTLIIDGTKYSNMSYADMRPLIETALGN